MVDFICENKFGFMVVGLLLVAAFLVSILYFKKKEKVLAFVSLGIAVALFFYLIRVDSLCDSKTPISGEIIIKEEGNKKIHTTLLDEYSRLGEINDSLHKEIKSLKGVVDFYTQVGVVKRIDTIYVDTPVIVKLPVENLGNMGSGPYSQRYEIPYFYDTTSLTFGGRVNATVLWHDDSSDVKVNLFSVDSMVVKSEIVIGTRKVDKYYEIFAYSQDPTISFNKLKGARLRRPSKFNIGVYGGLGLSTKGFQPQIGVGATYNLIPPK